MSMVAAEQLINRPCPVCLERNYRNKYELPAEAFFREKYSLNQATVVECKVCHLRFTNPILDDEAIESRYIDELSSYNVRRYDNPEKLYGEDQEICIKELLNHLNCNDSILDVGCGRGGFVYLCQKNNFNATGIDLNYRNIDVGTRLGVKNLFTKNLNDISDSSYHVITSIHVLEHLINCNYFITEFKRILKPHGIILVMVPNEHSFKCTLNHKRYWKAPYEHINGFRSRSLNHLFNQFGFKRVKLKAAYSDYSMLLTKYCGNLFNVFPTKLLSIYSNSAATA
jgi:2-polyprenyl-3-methyl-5-hydroxy-6-metoxy-1,4-benzoquinol methylase